MQPGRRSLRTLLSTLALIVVLAACGADDRSGEEAAGDAGTDEATTSTAAPATTAEPATSTEPETTTTTTEAPVAELELIGFGAFDVGVTTVTIAEDSERPLTVDVWFPLDDSAAKTEHEYTFLPGIFYRSPNAVTAELTDVSTAGPFPLIVYSHGSGGQRFIHSNYTETLASHGHVVIAADHTGNTLIESFVGATGDLESSAEARPRDIDVMLDAALNTDGPNNLGTALASALTDDPVVITGHSLGGFTLYASIAGLNTENVAFDGDTRIGAAITMAPFSTEEVLSDDLLASIDVPQLMMVGTDDMTTPVDPNVERLWELTPGSPTYRVELVAAEHLTFTDMCDYVTFLPELGTVPEFIVTELDTRSQQGCAEGDMPIARAQALTNTFALRFLDEFYNGAAFVDPSVETLPDDVIFDAR